MCRPCITYGLVGYGYVSVQGSQPGGMTTRSSMSTTPDASINPRISVTSAPPVPGPTPPGQATQPTQRPSFGAARPDIDDDPMPLGKQLLVGAFVVIPLLALI